MIFSLSVSRTMKQWIVNYIIMWPIGCIAFCEYKFRSNQLFVRWAEFCVGLLLDCGLSGGAEICPLVAWEVTGWVCGFEGIDLNSGNVASKCSAVKYFLHAVLYNSFKTCTRGYLRCECIMDDVFINTKELKSNRKTRCRLKQTITKQWLPDGAVQW